MGRPTTLGMFGGVVAVFAAVVVWCGVVVVAFGVVWAVAAAERAAKRVIEGSFAIIVVPV